MIIKVILLGLCVCILNIFLRQNQHTFAIVINIVYVVVVLVILIDSADDFLGSIKDLLGFSASAGKMLGTLFKGALICIITKISCSLCLESGNKVVSDVIDLAGRIVLLVMAFPFIESVIKTAMSFVQ